MRRRRVLMLNHTGLVGGAEHSMLTLLDAAREWVHHEVACPHGTLESRLPAWLTYHPIPEAEATFRLRGPRALRALMSMSWAAIRVRRIAGMTHAELIHANSVRAGLVALAARAVGGPPVVIHVRDRLPDGRISAVVRRQVSRRADAVIAISSWIADQYGDARLLARIDNPVDLTRFKPSPDVSSARVELGLADGVPLLGVIAQITPWKGQADAIRGLRHLADMGTTAELLLVGEAKFVSAATTNDNAAYLRTLHGLVADLDLRERVHFLGERRDVERIMGALDVLVAPSWSEPFGRSVAEALATGVPVVATNVGGPAELIEPGRTGLLVRARDPVALAAAVRGILAGGALREGASAYARSVAERRFDAGRSAQQVRDLYEEVLR